MKNNPIDKDKIADKPGLLPYASSVGSAIIEPIDKAKTKGLAMSAMYKQTERQLVDLKEQIETLMSKAQVIHDRIDISEKIYQAKLNFKPLIGDQYSLYKSTKGDWILSMIKKEEWNGKCPYEFLALVELLPDHTWDIIARNPTTPK